MVFTKLEIYLCKHILFLNWVFKKKLQSCYEQVRVIQKSMHVEVKTVKFLVQVEMKINKVTSCRTLNELSRLADTGMSSHTDSQTAMYYTNLVFLLLRL